MIMWAIKNWRIVLALTGVAGTLFAGGGLYMKGRLDATHAAAMRAAQKNLERVVAAQKADALQAKLDAAKIAELQSKVDNIDDGIKDPDRECFDAGDVDRLRNLWD